MTSDMTGDTSTDDAQPWNVRVELRDDGWIWMPEPGEDIAGWADQASTDAPDREIATAVAEQLRSYAVDFRERAHDVGAVWVPDFHYGVLAAMTCDAMTEGGL
ncbi:MAG: hypothetical protein GEU96_22865, partial [Propionibacteriales bacterium]|nr:hypothetical protein [Propionibacteriales bacterium]